MIIRIATGEGKIYEVALNKDILFDAVFLDDNRNHLPDVISINLTIDVNGWTGTYERLILIGDDTQIVIEEI